MKLLTSEIKQRLRKPQKAAAFDPDPVVHCKFFLPGSPWTWYVLNGRESNDGDWLFFGLVIGFETEFGDFSLSELGRIKGPLGLRVERDRYFTPCPLSEVVRRSSSAA